ncbi:hypothetical protein F2Q69_00031769 [Brassica cretica]|uniref:Uncharacterized protein n=1 Tax=Brassica cretica TaxID=69181 RepID=A0A8S9S2H0_BRACR|nr:hypothetical protein F2Q69_00031769 [Brassica cretica]
MRVTVVPSTCYDYRFWYTAVFSTACSRLCFWWFALPSAELSSSSQRRVAGFASGGSRFLRRNYPAFVSGEKTLMALRSSSTVIAGSAKIRWFVWFPRECSRCVKVVLVMVPVDSGVVVIPACSGEFRGHFLSSPVVTSRFGSRSVTVCCSGDACLSLLLR